MSLLHHLSLLQICQEILGLRRQEPSLSLSTNVVKFQVVERAETCFISNQKFNRVKIQDTKDCANVMHPFTFISHSQI